MSRRMAVLSTQLAGTARRPARLLLTGLAVIVAAAAVYGTVLAYRMTEGTALAGLSGTPAAADLVVESGEAPLIPAALDRIRRLPEVAEAAGRVQLHYELQTPAGPGLGVVADPGAGPLATVGVVRGEYPDAPGEIALTERTADRLALAVGDTATILVGAAREPVDLRVTAVVRAGEDFGQEGYTTDALAVALSRDDWLDRIEVRLAPGGDADRVSAALGAAVAGPNGAAPQVRSGAEVRAAEAAAVSDDIDQLFALVGMFVAIAVAAAALVATSTFRIVFAQRMRQLALLRAVGARRAALVRALAVEGALTGLVAGGVGVLIAAGLGVTVPPLLRAFGLAVVTPGQPMAAALAVVAGAVLLTAVAVLAPAFSAARVSPLEALRAASVTAGGRSLNAGRLAVGLLMAAGAGVVAAGVASRLPTPAQTDYAALPMLLAIVLSGTLAFFALVALGPVLLRPVLAVVGWPVSRLGPVGRLAVGGVGGAPRRAAAVSVVVALGVTLVAGVLIGGASLRTLLERELAGMAPADLQLAPRDVDAPVLPAGTVQRAGAAAELTGVVAYRRTAEVTLDRAELPSGTDVVDLDLRRLATWADFGAAAGSLDDLGPGRIVLLTFAAEEAGLRPGDEVVLRRAGRSVTVRVAATLQNTPVGAGALVDPADLDRLGVGPQPSGLLADAARPGERGRTAAVQALRALGGPELAVSVLADERDNVDSALDALIGVALGLIGMTVAVAVVGVGTTTALSVVERVRETGLLRAVGMTRSRLRTMLTLEAGLYGLVGAALGLLLALPYAWLTVAALGAGVPVEFPAGQLLAVVVALAAATALAGLLPARRAAAVSPVAALGTDG